MKKERTIRSVPSDWQSVVVAAVAANLLLFTLALAHHVLATRVATRAKTVPISPNVVERFPMQIEGWVGEDVPLDEDILGKTDSDAVINRRYSRLGGLAAVNLYVACGVNTSELLRHNPENCYSGAGWRLANCRTAGLPTVDGMVLPCTIYEFVRNNKGGTERIMALFYVVVDGQYYGSIPAVKWKIWRRGSPVRYAAEVQVVTPAGVSGDTLAAEAVSDFALDSFSSIARLFDHIAEE